MNCKFTNVLVFAVGAAIGSAVTWKFLKTKYERIAREEIESVKEVFLNQSSDRQKSLDELKDQVNEIKEHSEQIDWKKLEDLDEEDDELNDYEKLIDVIEDYTNGKGGAETVKKEPYVISPLDFGELDGYSQVELVYYEGDNVLEDEDYNIVTDRDELIGPKALFTFGEYEDDAVFVRNDYLRADFQILKDYRKYSDVRSTSPDQVDNE